MAIYFGEDREFIKVTRESGVIDSSIVSTETFTVKANLQQISTLEDPFVTNYGNNEKLPKYICYTDLDERLRLQNNITITTIIAGVEYIVMESILYNYNTPPFDSLTHCKLTLVQETQRSSFI